MNIRELVAKLWPFKQSVSSGPSTGLASPQEWLVDWASGGASASGVRVTTDSALGLPAVWSSVSLIAGHMGSIPIEVRRRRGEGSERDTRHTADKLLNKRPNHYQTAFTFKQTLMVHALLTGNGRALIIRDDLGRPTEIFPIFPSNAWTHLIDGEKYHMVWFDARYMNRELPYGPDDPVRRGPHTQTYVIPDYDVLHIPGLGYNGLWGYSLISIARNVFGLDDAGLQTASYVFQNNGKPNLVLEAPICVLPTEKEARELLSQFRAAHVGIDNSGRVGLLREGVTAKPLPMDAADAQYLESRKHSREDIALLLGTEYLLGSASAVYKDLQERMSAYVTNTLSRWLHLWEEEVYRKMLSQNTKEADSHFIHADPRQLITGSPNSLASYTGQLRQQGVLSGNEVREMHGFNPVADEALETFSNPNITVDQPESESDDEGAEEEPADNGADQKATRILFRNMIRAERKRVLELAGSDRFVQKLTRFYDGHESLMVDNCVELGLDPNLAREHCAKSQKEILDHAAVVDQFGLADVLDGVTRNWEQRAREFSDVVCIC